MLLTPLHDTVQRTSEKRLHERQHERHKQLEGGWILCLCETEQSKGMLNGDTVKEELGVL